MTKRLFHSLQAALSILCLLVIAGCEEPTPKSKQITPPAEGTKADPEPLVSQSESNETEKVVQEEVVVEKETVANKPGHPYFHVYRDGGKLIVEGELKSSGQVKQINSELERYFTKLKVESGLRKDPLRHAVGWGNRVSDAILFDYFSIVTDPDLEYKEGVVTLKGSVENAKQHRMVTEMAISAFSGVWTSDLVNEIKVGE